MPPFPFPLVSLITPGTPPPPTFSRRSPMQADTTTKEKEWNPTTNVSGRVAGEKVQSAKREIPKNKMAEAKKGMLEAIKVCESFASLFDKVDIFSPDWGMLRRSRCVQIFP